MSAMEQLPPPLAAGNDSTARNERLAALAQRRPQVTSASASAATAPRRVASSTASASLSNADTASTRVKRRHPARSARAAALGLSLVSTGGLATLFAFSGSTGATAAGTAQIVSGAAALTAASPSAATPAAPSATTPPAPSAATPAAPSTATPSAATPAAAATPEPTVVDGAVFHNKWGDVQIEATFAPDGTLIDVIALRAPDNRSTSRQINNYAVPRLNAEALASQSASVDTVSGATYTSNDYRKSLQSAIDAATQSGLAVASA
jgi:uncharacterized protein with FMN-binding domain